MKKTIYEPNPQVAKGLFLELPFQIIRGLWNEYLVCPKLSQIKFEDAENYFRTIINELFALLQPLPAFAYTGGGPSLSYFHPRHRDVIFEAGRLQRLLRIVYDNIARTVEPYSLTFKRRKDGVSREYFYAWDRSGGHSGQTGIKSFISDKLQSVQMTEQSFEPRFPIELTKVPSYFSKPYFSSSKFQFISKKRQTSSYSTGVTYTIECPLCRKKFKRNKFDTRLNDHKDRYGNRCFGRFGIIVQI